MYCHMVYYTKVCEAIFDAFETFRQIDGKLLALTLGCIKFKWKLMHAIFCQFDEIFWDLFAVFWMSESSAALFWWLITVFV